MCFEEEILGQKEEISPANRPHTAVPQPVAVPRPLLEEEQFPHRHIQKTRREREMNANAQSLLVFIVLKI